MAIGALFGILPLRNPSFAWGLVAYSLVFTYIIISGRNLTLAALGVTIFSIVFGKIAMIQISGRTPDLLYVDVFATLTTYIWLGNQAIKGQRFKFDIRVPAVVYAAVSIGTTLVQPNDLLRELSLLKTLIMGLMLYLVAYNSIETLQDSRRLLNILILLGLAISAAIVVTIATNSQDFWGSIVSDKNIVRLNFGKNNFLAAFLVIFIPIAASQIRRRKSLLQNIFFGGSLFLMFVVLLLTRSRGAMLSLALGFLVGGGVVLPRRTYFRILQIIGVVTITFPLVLPKNFLFTLVDRFINIWDSGNLERFHMWQVAWHGFLQHPVFGSGVGSTAYLIRNALNIPSLTSPHNYIFEFLAEVGIAGTLPILFIFATMLKDAWIVSKMSIDNELRYEYAFVLVGVISTLLNGLVEPLHRAPQYVVVFWVLVGIIGASKRIVVSESNLQSQPLK